jgi:DMSO/TMAO reductase YedYZ heme-binding membrane subunit
VRGDTRDAMKNSATQKGMRLLAVIAAAIAAMCAVLVIAYGGGAEAAHAVVRWTARTSLVLFTLAYVSRPLVQLRPHSTARDILAYRKWLGLGFATSHGFHLAGIVAIAWPAPGAFIRAQDPTIVIAIATFLLLGAMAVTSIERVRKAMQPKHWKRLHRTGMHVAWFVFFTTYAAAVRASALYIAPAAVLLVIAAIRAAAWFRGKRHQRAMSHAA